MSVVELDSVVLLLRKDDHVGVLKKTVKGGTELVGSSGTVTTAVTIPAGHKIALQPVTNGEAVRKYGQIIGFAEGELRIRGDHVQESQAEGSIGCGDGNADQPLHGGVTRHPFRKNPVLPVQLVHFW